MMRDMDLRHDEMSSGNRLPTSTSAKRPKTSLQSNDDFTREALQVHNDLRRKHGVEPLRLNADLSKLAQQWGKRHLSLPTSSLIFFSISANHLASTGALVHSKTKYRNSQVGENLYCQSRPTAGREMTEAWYNEHRQYDYNNRRAYQSGTGHFTQLVWKNSQEVGFAQAQGRSMHYTVAMYYPPGNYLGEYEKNIFPPH